MPRAITVATQASFEAMAESGSGDAGALTLGLRHGITALGLRSLAAKAVHVAAAAPERIADIYDNAAAGWLSGPVFPPKLRTDDPLPMSRGFWKGFWDLVNLPPDVRRKVLAMRTLSLTGELDPRISARMATTALTYPGVAEAVAGGIPEPYDVQALAACPPASLGYAFRQELLRDSGHEAWNSIVPLLRHMLPPLNYINIQVIQSLPLLGLVAGYTSNRLDQAAMGGFLMAQVGHHYSALSTAVTLTVMSLDRPKSTEVTLDCVFKGWIHGRETPPLINTPWEELWLLRIDQVREALGVTAFAPPYTPNRRQSNGLAQLH